MYQADPLLSMLRPALISHPSQNNQHAYVLQNLHRHSHLYLIIRGARRIELADMIYVHMGFHPPAWMMHTRILHSTAGRRRCPGIHSGTAWYRSKGAGSQTQHEKGLYMTKVNALQLDRGRALGSDCYRDEGLCIIGCSVQLPWSASSMLSNCAIIPVVMHSRSFSKARLVLYVLIKLLLSNNQYGFMSV